MPTHSGTNSPTALRAPYAVSGTELAHAATALRGAHRPRRRRDRLEDCHCPGKGSLRREGRGGVLLRYAATDFHVGCYGRLALALHAGTDSFAREQTRAGNQDWSELVGRVLCNACFMQFATRGTLVRPGRN
eukprot:2189468-Rhodomonas_salina.1